jgi:hypothetical protein
MLTGGRVARRSKKALLMDGLFFLAGIVGIWLVVRWTIRNDSAAPDGETQGFFAMR